MGFAIACARKCHMISRVQFATKSPFLFVVTPSFNLTQDTATSLGSLDAMLLDFSISQHICLVNHGGHGGYPLERWRCSLLSSSLCEIKNDIGPEFHSSRPRIFPLGTNEYWLAFMSHTLPLDERNPLLSFSWSAARHCTGA